MYLKYERKKEKAKKKTAITFVLFCYASSSWSFIYFFSL